MNIVVFIQEMVNVIQEQFFSNYPAVHVYKDAKSAPRDCENMHVRIDEVVKNKEDVQALGIQNGDYIAYDPKTEITESGFIKSRF